MAIRALLPLLSVAVAPIVMAQSGGISGTVTSTIDGSPVQGATVTYRRLVQYLPKMGTSAANPQLAPGEVYFTVTASTDALGRHSVTGLPPGNYQVCLGAAGSPIPDPCLWGKAPLASVGTGATVPLNIAVTPGVYLQVTLNDPQGLLPVSAGAPLTPPHIIVGVLFGTGAFLAAQRTAAGSGTQTYSMVVPAGMSLTLWLQSLYVALADANGNALDSSGAEILFTSGTGVSSTFTINVTGPLAAAPGVQP